MAEASTKSEQHTIDGMKIYRYGRGSQAVYEVRGCLIYEYARGTQAAYEIRGNLVHEYARGTQAFTKSEDTSCTSTLGELKQCSRFVDLWPPPRPRPK